MGCSTGVGYGGQAAIVRIVDEAAVISVTSGVAARLEVFDPGFVRTRRGVRAVCATVLAWATMVAVTSAFDVADPVRITLFAAGAAFEGALLAPDPQPRDRVRTLGWASVVAAVAVVVTVALTQTAVWVAAALLVLLMFSSYALRSWSPRVASLALMGAITVYITGAGYITIGRIGWFVLALVVGFGWFALWETLILPDNPLRSLNLSVQAFSRRAADTVSGIVDALNTARDGTPSERAGKALRRQPRPGEEVSQRHRNAVPRRRRARLQSKRCRPAARGAALGPKRTGRTWPIRPKFRTGCGRCLTRSSGRSAAPCTRCRRPARRRRRGIQGRRRPQSSGTPRPHKPSADANNEDCRGAVSAGGAARGAHVARRWRDRRPIRHAGKEVGRRRTQGRRRRATKE